MPDQEQNSHLSELALELAIIILESLPDYDSLFATIQTSQRLYQCFKGNTKRIITSISFNIYQRAIKLDSQTKPFPYQGSCLIIQQLISVIKSRYIPRNAVLDVFKKAWELLFDKRLEELLIPLGKDLAWSLELENRQQDAMKLLQQIIRRESPFKLSRRKLSKDYSFPIFAPLRSFMLRFPVPGVPEETVSIAKRENDKELEQLQQLPVALITMDGMRFFHDDEILQYILFTTYFNSTIAFSDSTLAQLVSVHTSAHAYKSRNTITTRLPEVGSIIRALT
ncbi:hypothetical protein DPV78_000651 [Talaromyces pinophilus]|nr:hypothetical protein DPV78_000651 [Talaromyces pinophilus]